MNNRIQFYHNLAVMLESGLSLDHALRQNFPGGFHRTAELLRRSVQAGSLFHEAMQSSRVFTDFECNIIAVGEVGGNLPATLFSLEEWLTQKQKIRSRIIHGMALPVFLYFMAALILTGVDLFLKKICPVQAVEQLVCVVAIPLAALILLRIAGICCRKYAITGYLLEPIPILGSLQHKLESSRFFQAMGLSLASGLPMLKSIRIAAECCRNRYYTGRYLKMIPMIQTEGESFSSAFQRIQIRRDIYSPIPALVSTGEISGQLDIFCTRIGKLMHEEACQLLTRIAGMVPLLFYFIVLAFIAWKIIAIFGNYIQQLNTL